jgi:hypothetical protein
VDEEKIRQKNIKPNPNERPIEQTAPTGTLTGGVPHIYPAPLVGTTRRTGHVYAYAEASA